MHGSKFLSTTSVKPHPITRFPSFGNFVLEVKRNMSFETVSLYNVIENHLTPRAWSGFAHRTYLKIFVEVLLKMLYAK